MNYGPFVIVGQARSGSTLLTRLLADTRDFFILNDAYILQYVDEVSSSERFSQETARKIAQYCLDMLRRRAVTEDVTTVNRSIYLDSTQLMHLEEDVMRRLPECRTAEDVIARVMRSGARLVNAQYWGWNTPQDYLCVDRILDVFPTAKILFLIRNPYNVLKSYKNLPDYWGDEKDRYHPIMQSLVWRQVVREYKRLSAIKPQSVMLVRYEDIVADSPEVWRNLQSFLGDFSMPIEAEKLDKNSSHGTRSTKHLTAMEVSICKMVSGGDMKNMGYADHRPRKEYWGGIDFCRTTYRSLRFYAGRVFRSRDMRQRIKRLGLSMVSRRG